MQKVFEKIVNDKVLEKAWQPLGMFDEHSPLVIKVSDIKEIVKQAAAEYNNGWIPVEDGLPDHHIDVEVTLANGVRHIGWYSGVREEWIDTLKIYEEPLNVVAWKEPSDPYQPHICTNNDCMFNEEKDCPAAEGCAGYERKRTNFDMCCESMEAMAQIIDIAKIGWTKEQIMEWLQKEVEE